MRAPVSGRSSGDPQPRSATRSLAALAPATGLEKRFGRPEFRKVSRRRLQRLLDKVRGAIWGCMGVDRAREELGASQPGPQPRDRRHFARASQSARAHRSPGTGTTSLEVSGPGRRRPAAPNCHGWVSGPLKADTDLLNHKPRHRVNCGQGHSKAIAFKRCKWIWEEQCELTDFDFSISY